MPSLEIEAFFDENTNTVSYIAYDLHTCTAAVIDPVLDYDAAAGRTSHASADALITFLKSKSLKLEWILETHVHADHLSAAPYLKQQCGGRIAIGECVKTVQETFAPIFGAEAAFKPDGSQFDHLFADGDAFSIGEIAAKAMHTPGHTPACMTYVIGDTAFVGDTLFMPDYGTARCDFPGGDADILYSSIQKILSLPAKTRIFTCHDYKAEGRDHFAWESTVAEQKASNIHIHEGASREEFTSMRLSRDKQLSVPALIIPSVQVNMRGGELPPADENGRTYLKTPINVL